MLRALAASEANASLIKPYTLAHLNMAFKFLWTVLRIFL